MSCQTTVNDIWFMQKAFDLAQNAKWSDEVPVGCILVDGNGQIVSETYNQKETKFDVTSHAEIESLRNAGEKLRTWRLTDLTMYVTLEPCPMCLSAVLQARLKRVVFGAYDKKGGAISLGYAFHKDKRFNHNFKITGGILHFECSKLLSDYFKEKRKNYKN